MRAWFGGECLPPADATVEGVGAFVPHPACNIFKIAPLNAQMTKTRYDLPALFTPIGRAVRRLELDNYQAAIDSAGSALRAAYGDGAPADIKWHQMPECLWSRSGAPGGPLNDKYFSRDALTSAGYAPLPIIGGQAFSAVEQRHPKLASRMPVWLDRVVRPGLAMVLVFVFLVLIFAALVLQVRPRAARAESRAKAPAPGGAQPEPEPEPG